MIVGLLSNVAANRVILPVAIARGIEAMHSLDPLGAAPGRYELEGDKLFCLIQDVESRQFADSRPEAHRRFADVQIPLNAKEGYGFSQAQADLAIVEDRLEANDVAFFANPACESVLTITPGEFVVFMPGELHRPCLTVDHKTLIRKAVLKVHVSLLGL